MNGMFEIVRTNAGWHARYRAENEEIVWTTEVYESKQAARQAIYMLPNGVQWLKSYTPVEFDNRTETL